MLSYQHAYHAGNHADILKHCILTFVLNHLNSKDKPYTFYDTHSGSGIYDLLDNRSCKTGEAQKGILQLFHSNEQNMPELLTQYLKLTSVYLEQNLYPGSPEIERALMRSKDTLILSELHPQEIENLRENMKKHASQKADEPSIQIHNRNGWEMLKALTPPKTVRGAVLIDPSYEEEKDYKDAAETIISVNKKWSSGIILLWYPLLAYRENMIEGMLQKIMDGVRQNNRNIEISRHELKVFDKNEHVEKKLEEVLEDSSKKNPPRLYGSGILAINSPWKLKEEADSVISFYENEILPKKPL